MDSPSPSDASPTSSSSSTSSSSVPQPPGRTDRLFAPIFALVCVMAAFALALVWSWSAFQGRVAQAAYIPLKAQELSMTRPDAHSLAAIEPAARMDFPPNPVMPIALSPTPDVHATESFDAASAEMMAGHAHDQPPRLIPASLPAPTKEVQKQDHASPRIAIIIDDMGLARRNSVRAVNIDAPLTLSYLPYADDVQAQVDDARAKGHEIMLHLPMEAFDRHMYPGPGALTTRLEPDVLTERVKANLSAFTGYRGINNHMGSRLTSDTAAMELVMREIDRKSVFFVDSWTSPRSVAYQAAAARDIPRGRRDVFLDHYEGETAVWNALKQAEYLARRHGSAVVIGHPKNDTINVLQAWLPGAEARGVQIVPMSDLVYRGSIERDPVLMADAARRQRVAGR